MVSCAVLLFYSVAELALTAISPVSVSQILLGSPTICVLIVSSSPMI
jgi:hypothetical protein